MNDPLIRVEDAGRLFVRGGRSRWVLRNIDLEVRPGETTAIMGPSGSGKTTLLQLIAGLDRPSEGDITWPALASPLHPSQIGVAFQGPSLLPPLTVLENVAFPALIAEIAEPDAIARSRKALEVLGIAGLEDHLPEDLSGGEAQRAVIARAIVLEPPLVILDEPTGQLDQTTAARVLDAVLARSGLVGSAVVVATHDAAVATRSQRVMELRGGHLMVGGPLRSD